MHSIDIAIVAAYLGLMILTGLYFQRKASSGIDAYFLGNHKLPWWVLGASGMASNLDVSGTMINVAMIYAFGAMGIFIELRGGLVLIMAFLMIFMGKWNRRANVMTMAEWMKLRFGNGIQGKTARIITAVATLMTTIWIITYFAVGAGKFIGEFIGLPELFGLSSQFWAAALMISLAMIYTVTSGLYGVVWTDVFQGILIFATILIICFIALIHFQLPEIFSISIPLKEGGFSVIEVTRDQWTSIIPVWQLNFPENSSYSVYNIFGIVLIFYVIRLVIEGSAGTGGYMIQRFYSARSDREAGLLSLFWTFLLAFRWPFIVAIALMGIALGVEQGTAIADPEKVLPIVINRMVPIGLKGLLFAGLMAAAMSTFDSLVNAGASYWVKDIYQAFLKPDATESQLLLHSRISSVLIVLAGLFFSISITNLNEIWGWLTMGIGSGLIVPMLIRWYWWRLNGYGFAAGVAAGMITALLQRWLIPDLAEYWAFALVAACSTISIFLITLLTKQTSKEDLKKFYQTTRPFGFWKPISREIDDNLIKSVRTENKRDIISTFLAVPWQMTLFLTMMVVILRNWESLIYLSVLLIFLSTGLYFFWYRHLDKSISISGKFDEST